MNYLTRVPTVLVGAALVMFPVVGNAAFAAPALVPYAQVSQDGEQGQANQAGEQGQANQAGEQGPTNQSGEQGPAVN